MMMLRIQVSRLLKQYGFALFMLVFLSISLQAVSSPKAASLGHTQTLAIGQIGRGFDLQYWYAMLLSLAEQIAKISVESMQMALMNLDEKAALQRKEFEEEQQKKLAQLELATVSHIDRFLAQRTELAAKADKLGLHSNAALVEVLQLVNTPIQERTAYQKGLAKGVKDYRFAAEERRSAKTKLAEKTISEEDQKLIDADRKTSSTDIKL
jgi:hypothetical protein